MLRFQKIAEYLLVAALFLLPWQTRFIYEKAFINGAPWEYGTKSLYATELLLGLLSMVSICAVIQSRAFLMNKKNQYLNIAVVVVGIMVLVMSVLVSIEPSISYQFVNGFVIAVCFMLLVSRSSYSSVVLSAALWVAGVVQALLGLVQFFTQQVLGNKWLGMASHTAKELGASVVESGDERWLRAYGSFGSPNSLGIFLAFILVIGLVLYVQTESHRKRLLLTCGQLIIASGLVVSFSRGAWIAGAFGIVTVIIQSWRRGWHSEIVKQVFFYSLISIFFIIALLPLFTTRLTQETRLEVRSVAERESQLREAWNVIREHPLHGVGPGAYTAYLAKAHPQLSAYDLQPVHNIYFLVMAEWGVVVAVIIFVAYAYLLKRGLQNKSWFLAGIVVLGVGGLFDHGLYTLFTGQLIWFAGIGFLLRELQKK
jgi:O-antigen ligase